jgi:hypothetical protein
VEQPIWPQSLDLLLVCSIRQLSIEILASIFVHCLPFAGNSPFIIPKVIHAPSFLCEIRGNCRKVPSLSFGRRFLSIVRRFIELWYVSLWTSQPRSLALPLCVSYIFLASCKNSEKAIFAMFPEDIDRWQDVHLRLDIYISLLSIPAGVIALISHIQASALYDPSAITFWRVCIFI